MSDKAANDSLLDKVMYGGKMTGAVLGEAALAAADLHPGVSNPDSTFSLIDMVRGKTKNGSSLGDTLSGGTYGDTPGMILTGREDETTAGLNAAVRLTGKDPKKYSNSDNFSNSKAPSEPVGKNKAKKGKGKLASLAKGLPPISEFQYAPTMVDVSVAPYTGGPPTRTAEQYAKDNK